MVGFLPDPGHDQDVVVLAEGEQEDEHQKRQDEDQPVLPTQVDDHQRGRAQRGQVRQHDADHQVDGRDQAAQHQAKQDRDGQHRDRDDPHHVACCRLADVVERGCLADDAVGQSRRTCGPPAATAARTAGVASIAAVLCWFPARSAARNWTVRPSALTY